MNASQEEILKMLYAGELLRTSKQLPDKIKENHLFIIASEATAMATMFDVLQMNDIPISDYLEFIQ